MGVFGTNYFGRPYFAGVSAGTQLTLSLSDSVTASDGISVSTIFHLSDSTTPVDAISKTDRIIILDAVTPLESISNNGFKVLSDSVSTSDSSHLTILLNISDSISTSDGITGFVISVIISDSVTASDLITTSDSHTLGLSDGILSVDDISAIVTKFLTDSVSVTDDLSLDVTLLESDTVTTTDGITTDVFLGEFLTDEVNVSDSTIKRITSPKSETVVILDDISKSFFLVLGDSVSTADQFSVLKRASLSDEVIASDGTIVFRITEVVHSTTTVTGEGSSFGTAGSVGIITERDRDEERYRRILLDDDVVFSMIRTALYNIN